MSKAKTKAKPVAKKPPVKPSKKVAKAAPPKKAPAKAKKPTPKPQEQMTGKPRKAVHGDNGGPALDFDVGVETVAKPPEQLAAIREKGEELVMLQKKAEEIGLLLAEVNGQVNKLATEELPRMLADVQLNGIELESGFKVELIDKLVGTLPKEADKRAKAFEVIEERDGGDIIKSMVSVAFAKSELEQAQELVEELKDRDLPAEVKVDVHHQTLLSWAKDYLEDEENIDNPLPLADLGLSYIHFVKVKEPKKPKAPKPGHRAEVD